MLFCCCKNWLRPYCFVVLIVTLIFHIYEIILLGQNFQKEKWTITLLLCHMVVVLSAIASFKGVILKKEKPLLIFLIFTVFGFIPIITDMVLVIVDNKKIFTFDTSFIESTYGSNAVKPIVCLILTLLLVIKTDLTVVVYQYYKELRTNFAPAENSRS